MGRDERLNQLNSRILMAEVERTAGPTRDFGTVAECPKCKLPNESVLYDFCVGNNALSDNPKQCPISGEHNHRLCPRCKFGWFERCADYKPEPLVVDE